MRYTLELRQLTDAGEPTGQPVEVCAVDTDGEITGQLADAVREILALDRVRLGLTGESVRMQPTRAWLVAYVLGISNMVLIRAGFENAGLVYALDVKGELIPMPEQYREQLDGDVIDTSDPTVGIEHTTA